ncbi:undecaprenyl-diphosphate phosphatase [bacterium]|nr:undecaprenyl-diphosphate phosphatase [bacterium]
MDWNYVVLGLIQGATEFLPVSSSGHLLLFERVLLPDMGADTALAVNVLLHMGTLFAILLYFKQPLFQYLKEGFSWLRKPARSGNETQKEILWILVLSVPTAAIGLALKKGGIGEISPNMVLVALGLTGLLCIATDYLPKRDAKLNLWRSLFLGVVQGVAVIPGISRSGSTIFAGLLGGISREKMASFSFLMSIPAIFGAFFLESLELYTKGFSGLNVWSVLPGILVAFFSGYLALGILIRLLKRHYFRIFGVYCLLLSIFGKELLALGNPGSVTG